MELRRNQENGSRRRRNIDMDALKERWAKEKESYGIDWPGMNREPEIEEEEETEVCEEEEFPLANTESAICDRYPEEKIIKIEGKEISLGPLKQPRTALSREAQKVTIYLDKELVEAMNTLKKARFVTSISWLVAEATKYYLANQKKGNSKRFID